MVRYGDVNHSPGWKRILERLDNSYQPRAIPVPSHMKMWPSILQPEYKPVVSSIHTSFVIRRIGILLKSVQLGKELAIALHVAITIQALHHHLDLLHA